MAKPIRIAIIGDDSQLKKTLKKTTKQLEGFGKSVAKVGATAGLAFAATATAVATKGVTAFADFEKGMNEVLTLLPGAGKEAFDRLGDQVKGLSKEMGILPNEVIPALYQSISAGIPEQNVAEFLRVAAMAAKGGITDLETAVDGITSVTNSWGHEVISATEASDLMFTAVRLGKTDFNQMSKEIYKVGPIAAAVGIDFGSVTAALANLTAQGTPTAVAATQLKAAFAELAKEGTKADTAFRDFTGVGMTEFLAQGGTFEEALIKLKEGADEAGISLVDVFGSIEAGAGMLALTSDGGAAFSATLAEMGASAGATQVAFETMDQGLSATFDKIKANLSVMAIETGEKLAPHVLAATEAIMDAFQRLQPHIERAKEVVREWVLEFIERATPAFNRFVEIANKVIDWVRAFVKENPHPVLAALAVLVASIVIPVVLGLVAAFFALFSPVVLIVGALALLAGGAVYAYENFETFRNVVDTVRDWLVNTLWPALKVVAENIVIAFWAVVEFFRNDFIPIVRRTVEITIAVWQAVANFFMTYLWPTISVVLDYITTAFWALLRFFQEDFVPLVQEIVAAVVEAWQAVLTFYEEVFVPVVLAVVEALTAAWVVFADFFMEYVWPIIKVAFDAIIDVLNNFWDVIVAMYEHVKALFSGDFKEVWFTLRTMIGEVIQYVVDLFIRLPLRIWSAAQPLTRQFLKIVGLFTVYLFNKLVDLILWIPEQIREFMSGIGEDMLTLGKMVGGWIIDGLIAAVKAAAGAVAAAVRAIIPDVGGMVRGAIGGIGGAIKGIIPGMASGGIVTSPTLAVIGEAGPEAVIPLNRVGTGGSTFNITVNAGMGTDGRAVGTQIVSALKQWERTNGSLPLSVSAV